MRIVFTTHAYEPATGFAERYAQGVAEAVAALGHEVHVITHNHATSEAFYEHGHPEIGTLEEEINGVVVHRIEMTPQQATRPEPVAAATVESVEVSEGGDQGDGEDQSDSADQGDGEESDSLVKLGWLSRLGVRNGKNGGRKNGERRSSRWLLNDASRPENRPIPIAHAHKMWKKYAKDIGALLCELEPDATVTLPQAHPNVSATLNDVNSGVTVYAPLIREDDPYWRVDTIAGLIEISDVVLATTKWELKRLLDDYGAVKESTHLAPHAVGNREIIEEVSTPRTTDTETVTTESGRTDTSAPPTQPDSEPHSIERTSPHDAPYVISVGRRIESNNYLMTAEAVREANSGGTPLRFLVAGGGEDKRLDKKLTSVGDFVEILGAVEENEKWSLLEGAAAYVSMSAMGSFGVDVMEAWAVNTPVIARQVPSVASVISDGEDGLLVNDADELSRALSLILHDPLLAEGLTGRGVERVIYKYNETAATLLSGIESALERSVGETTDNEGDYESGSTIN